jgi:hypothetical protein
MSNRLYRSGSWCPFARLIFFNPIHYIIFCLWQYIYMIIQIQRWCLYTYSLKNNLEQNWTADRRVDWLVLNANISSISAISWRGPVGTGFIFNWIATFYRKIIIYYTEDLKGRTSYFTICYLDLIIGYLDLIIRYLDLSIRYLGLLGRYHYLWISYFYLIISYYHISI